MNFTVRNIVKYAFLGVLCFVGQIVMAPLPNIEPVSLLVMLYAVCFGFQSMIAVYVFVFLEYLLYGFNVWSICYLYIWTILFVLAWLFRKQKSSIPFIILSALFGFAFGALCSLTYLFLFGWQSAISWWINGIVFDALHCLGNLVLAALLFNPLRKLLTKLNHVYEK